MSNVAIALYTYDRMETAAPTLDAALRLGSYPEPVHVHIADDGSPDGYVDALVEIARSFGPEKVRLVTVSNAERRGYGCSYNLASQAIHDTNNAVLSLEDDWLLQRPLDFGPLIETLAADNGIECVRLGYIGYTNELRGAIVPSPAGHMLLFDPESSEHHVFAGHARFESVAFRRAVGAWPEGLRPGETEFEVCRRWASRVGVAWPMDLAFARGDLFEHSSGRSYNQTVPERFV